MNNIFSGRPEDLQSLLQQYYALAEQQGNRKLIDFLVDSSRDLNEDARRLTIIGNIENSLLNLLLGKAVLKQSPMLLNTALEIKATMEGEDPYLILMDQRHSITSELIRMKQNDSPTRLFVDNKWLRDHNISVSVRPYPATLLDGQLDLLKFFSGTDLVLFLTNAQVVLTRTESQLLQKCEEMNIPFLIGILQLDMLEPSDKIEVVEYAHRFVERFDQEIPVVTNFSWGTENESAELFAMLENEFSKMDLPSQRLDMFLAKFLYCLLDLRNSIVARHEQMIEQAQIIKNEEDKDILSISRRKDQWMGIENELTQKRHFVDQHLRSILSENRKQSVSNLLYMLERSNDAKFTWEKELVYSINRELQISSQSGYAIIQKDIADVKQWLYAEVQSIFQYKPKLNSTLDPNRSVPEYKATPIKLMNTHGFRTRSKVGNAATMLGAGTLLVSVPIGGLVIATSLIYQTVMDQHIHNKQKKERDLLRPELLNVMEKLELQVFKKFSDWLKQYFENITTDLRMSSQNWHAAAMRATHEKSNSALAGLGDLNAQADALERLNAIAAHLI